MKIIVADSYEAMSRQAADDVVQLVSDRPQPVICTASGDSPAGLYRQIVERVRSGRLSVSNWLFVGLDEWVPMNGSDEGSCRYHLDVELFHPLKIPDERICFFDGRKKDLERQCQRVEDFIRHNGGIDIAILGLGMNGHVGMNEPGTPAGTHSHIAELSETTKQVGQKYFKSEQQLTKGITLGIASLMEARHVVLVVSGKHKAHIASQMIDDEISEQLPASLLRKHPSLKVYLDKEAAGQIILS